MEAKVPGSKDLEVASFRDDDSLIREHQEESAELICHIGSVVAFRATEQTQVLYIAVKSSK